jgi:hypothetical protein
MPKIINAKIKNRIKELIIEHSYVPDENLKGRRMKVSCGAIAHMLFIEIKEDVSDRTVAGMLLEMNTDLCDRGGIRAGAGRPQGSENKHDSSNGRKYQMHNLDISDLQLVIWASSVYSRQDPIWDSAKDKWTRPERHRIIIPGYAPGLRNVTIRPIADKHMNIRDACAAMK